MFVRGSFLAEVVKAANGAEDFTGEDSRISSRLQTKLMVVMNQAALPKILTCSRFSGILHVPIFFERFSSPKHSPEKHLELSQHWPSRVQSSRSERIRRPRELIDRDHKQLMQHIGLALGFLVFVQFHTSDKQRTRNTESTKTAAKSAAMTARGAQGQRSAAYARAIVAHRALKRRSQVSRSNAARPIARANCGCALAGRSRAGSTVVSQSMGSRGSCRSGKRSESFRKRFASKSFSTGNVVMQSTCRQIPP